MWGSSGGLVKGFRRRTHHSQPPPSAAPAVTAPAWSGAVHHSTTSASKEVNAASKDVNAASKDANAASGMCEVVWAGWLGCIECDCEYHEGPGRHDHAYSAIIASDKGHDRQKGFERRLFT